MLSKAARASADGAMTGTGRNAVLLILAKVEPLETFQMKSRMLAHQKSAKILGRRFSRIMATKP